MEHANGRALSPKSGPSGRERKRARSKQNLPSDVSSLTHSRVDCTSDLVVDFKLFSSKFPDFETEFAALNQRQNSSLSSHVNFGFNVALTRAILKENFRLSLPSMPEGHLCPPVPNRLNFVIWLEKLLRLSNDATYFKTPGCCGYRHRGIDIGCGASCIYPLLLTTDRFFPDRKKEGRKRDWDIFTTDIDAVSTEAAIQNVEANGLEGRIRVALVPKTRRQVESSSRIDGSHGNQSGKTSWPGPALLSFYAFRTSLPAGSDASCDFIICNPPFYATVSEATSARRGDGRARTDMTCHEGIYPGGEIGFVHDMISDSMNLSGTITWFACMVSKKSSLVELEKKLCQKLGRGAVWTATFLQGKTTRWGIAWTYRSINGRSPAIRVVGGLQTFEVELTDDNQSDFNRVDEVVSRVCTYCDYISCLKNLDLSYCVKRNDDDSKVCTIARNANNDKCMEALVDVHISGNSGRFEVDLKCFARYATDRATIDLFRSQLKGEIRRDNRRWRRMLANINYRTEW